MRASSKTNIKSTTQGKGFGTAGKSMRSGSVRSVQSTGKRNSDDELIEDYEDMMEKVELDSVLDDL